MQLDEFREKVLDAALTHVPFDGWTLQAAEAACADLGLEPGSAARAFPNGGVDMIRFFNSIADRRMVEEMERRNVDQIKIRERISLGVRIRLEQNAPHREAIRRALAVLAMPLNAAVAAQCLYHTVDAIWYAAGDQATDFSYYTKRGLLAGVYAATVLYWLDDASEDHERTWAFLDRRVADAMRVPKALARLSKPFETLPNPFRLWQPTRTGGPSGSAGP